MFSNLVQERQYVHVPFPLLEYNFILFSEFKYLGLTFLSYDIYQ